MEKFIQFTEEQKSLVWRTKVQPAGGTADDARLFMEVCEQYGLNPLLGDIVFQRYETKRGPVVNFIVSRDGYLKAAMRDKDFVKCVSAVIKEGDDFQMDIDGNVQHKFGSKRGNIIGAWAYAEHKTRGKLPVIVDFLEYFRANASSQNGRSPIWDSMPSAMIQKVAEVAALRRQFPLGGIVTEEEMGMDPVTTEEVQQPVSTIVETPIAAKETETKKTNENKRSSTKKAEKEDKKQKNTPVAPEEKTQPVTVPEGKEEKTTELPVTEQTAAPIETSPAQEEPAKEEKVEKEEAKQEPAAEETKHSFKEWTVLGIREGTTPQGSPFAKVAVEDRAGNKVIAYARDEALKQLDTVEDHQTYMMDIQNINGYDFLMAVGEPIAA